MRLTDRTAMPPAVSQATAASTMTRGTLRALIRASFVVLVVRGAFLRGLQPFEVHALDAPPPNALDHDPEPRKGHALTRPRNAAEQRVDETSDRRHVLQVEVPVEPLAQVVERNPARHPVAAVALLLNLGFLDVVLVADLADDFLEDVLDGDEARGAAIFVADD